MIETKYTKKIVFIYEPTVHFFQMCIAAGHCAESHSAIFTFMRFFTRVYASMLLQKTKNIFIKKTQRISRVKKWSKFKPQTTKSQFLRNPFAQTSHTNGLFIIPVWDSICIARDAFLRYDLSHCVHLCLKSVWLIWCEFNRRFVLYLWMKKWKIKSIKFFNFFCQSVSSGTPNRICRIYGAVHYDARSNGLPKSWHVWKPFHRAHIYMFLFLNTPVDCETK